MYTCLQEQDILYTPAELKDLFFHMSKVQIGLILNKYNIRTIFKPPKKIGQILRNPKDERPPLNSAGVYKISCFCGQVYIGKTRRMVNLRIKEHQRDVRIKHVTQSLSEYNKTGHQILFDKTIIANITSYFPRKYREATEIQKHPNKR